MINFCTTFDKNYLLKGLALRQSLIEQLGIDKFRLYVLCIDDETYNTLVNIKDADSLELLKLSDLEQSDDRLNKAQNNPPTNYGSQRENYIWSLTPYFVNYLLENRIPIGERLIYADSDIYFYKSPQIILDVVGLCSLGVHTHRFGPRRTKLDVGWYNVGVVVFANNKVGQWLSETWLQLTLDPTNQYYKEYGTCGDQKYLELLVEWGDRDVCVFDDNERVSHRAPWCCDEDGKPVVFFHFSHFTFDLKNNTWSDSIKGEWKPTRHNHIKPYYEQYFEKIKQASKLIE